MPTKPTRPDHIAQADWDAVDSPPLTEAELAQLRPAREVLSAEFLEAQLPSWLHTGRAPEPRLLHRRCLGSRR